MYYEEEGKKIYTNRNTHLQSVHFLLLLGNCSLLRVDLREEKQVTSVRNYLAEPSNGVYLLKTQEGKKTSDSQETHTF
jgi:hypothetical protein